ncbi:MAG: MBL fold metallo-hydrolase [Saprospiraceae bacterium]|nr:MBL fold metallo-hydrolase [Saprospiraceae bacterium]
MKIQFSDSFLTVFESALYRTCTTVIDLSNAVLLVDPNWLPAEIQVIKDFIQKKYNNVPLYILFTHSDYDHIIGWKAFPEATVISSEAFVANDKKDDILLQIKNFDNTYYIRRPYPILYPEADIIISQDITTLQLGFYTIIFYHAIGHVKDGLFAIIPELNIWIAGDYLSNIEIPMIDHDYHSYVETIKKATEISEKYNIQYLITGHGDIAIGPFEIKRRIENDSRYLDDISSYKNIISKEFHPRLLNDYDQNPEIFKIHEANLLNISKSDFE